MVTGASYVSPWRGQDDKYQSFEDRDKEMREFREKLKKSNSILCIGAGTTGVETASYLKETWPDKKIGVCQRGSVMVPEIPGAHAIIDDILKKVGVHYHPNSDYKSEGGGIGDEYEIHVDCRGFKVLGPSKFLQQNMSDCIDPKTGQIWVNNFCQVVNKHPIATNH